MKIELQYALLYDDGSWSGLFSTERQALRAVPKRRRKGEPGFIGIFHVDRALTDPDYVLRLAKVSNK